MEFSDDLVPVLIPAKGGGTRAIRAILTSSKEDKILLEVPVYISLDFHILGS